MSSFKQHFNIPENISYLNAASMTPISCETSNAGKAGVERKCAPWAIGLDDHFSGVELLKDTFGRLINASGQDIALAPAVSYGLQVAANNIEVSKGQNIVILQDQFPSDYYCWKQLCEDRQASLSIVSCPGNYDWTSAVLDQINDDTAIVSTPNCQWTDGTLIDLVRVGEKCREVGAAFVVDATQSLGVYPLDIQKVKPDFLACANYKWLLGPYSLAFLYVAPRYHNGRPLEFSSFSKANVRNPREWFGGKVSYTDEFVDGAGRYDFGETANFALVPMATKAITQILDWKVEVIADHVQSLTRRLIKICGSLNLTYPPVKRLAGHMVGLRSANGFQPDLVNTLKAKGIYVALRGDCLRVSPHIYNDIEDIDNLEHELKSTFDCLTPYN